MRRWGILVSVALCACIVGPHVGAATVFANPAFEDQWRKSEAASPNFWGPLTLASGSVTEPYVEGTLTNGATGLRAVQYFDKGRMEITRPQGAVANGLLTVELVTGKLQTGDNGFEQRQPAAIPIAGDPGNVGPTYATLAVNGALLLAPALSTPGATPMIFVNRQGVISTATTSGNGVVNIGAYDVQTQHNVASAFVTYRYKVGLSTVGLAISEPFFTRVAVGGKPTEVLVQAFERRVLTYTAANAAPFQVEFGNIGQHYRKWRYPNGTPTA